MWMDSGESVVYEKTFNEIFIILQFVFLHNRSFEINPRMEDILGFEKNEVSVI